MSIQVWKKFFGDYRMVSDHLKVTRKYTSWCHTSFASKSIPISSELYTTLLGVRQELCPHNGTQPEYGSLKTGYACHDKTTPEGDCNTVEHCTVCDYFRVYPGNPRFRAAYGSGGYGDGEGHPERTYMVYDCEFARLTDASINSEGELTFPTNETGTLIIWVCSRWHLRQDGAERAAERAFPDAEIVSRTSRYLILRDARIMADA